MGALFVLRAVGSRKITAGILLCLELRLLMGGAFYVFFRIPFIKADRYFHSVPRLNIYFTFVV